MAYFFQTADQIEIFHNRIIRKSSDPDEQVTGNKKRLVTVGHF